jgi:hypothetical protein
MPSVGRTDMRAHFVPVAYLKGFADVRSEARSAKAFAIPRERPPFRTSLDNLCVCTDYYTTLPHEDATLFEAQETLFGKLLEGVSAGDFARLQGIAPHLWRMKIRNRSILDSTRYKQILMAAAQTMDLGLRETKILTTTGVQKLITSDDPIMLFGDGGPSLQAFLLPLSPEIVLVDVPSQLFSVSAGGASDEDVDLLNKYQCQQAHRYVMMRDEPTLPATYQKQMPAQARGASSGVAIANNSGAATAYLNFISYNPRGAGVLPGFLTERR